MGNYPLRYRELLKLAMRFGVYEIPKRGKGSERLWGREAGGRRLRTTVTCHNENDTVGVGLISATRRRLHLDPAHGVSDKDFYGK